MTLLTNLVEPVARPPSKPIFHGKRTISLQCHRSLSRITESFYLVLEWLKLHLGNDIKNNYAVDEVTSVFSRVA